MKPSVQVNIVLLAGVICMFASLFHKPIGLPDWTAFVAPPLGAVLVWCAVWLSRRAKKRGDVSIITPTQLQYNKRIRLILVCVVVGSLSAPLYLHYIGPPLPLYQLVIVSLLGCATCVTVVLLSTRRNRPKV